MSCRPSTTQPNRGASPGSQGADQFSLALDGDDAPMSPTAAEAGALSRDTLLAALSLWVALGWLRQLDRHFALFLLERDPAADPLVGLAAALVSHQVGRGHVCLSLSRVLDAPRSALSLPPLENEGENESAEAVVLPESLLDPVTPARWFAALIGSTTVAEATAAEGLATPLVVDGDRVYLRRYWQAESAVAARLRQRLGPPLAVDEGLSTRLQALFAGNRREQGEPDWQRVACALALRQRLTIISGGPGTGKTTTVTRLLALLQEQSLSGEGEPLRIRLAAPTGKAAARLSESIAGAVGRLEVSDAVRAAIPQEAQTLHRLLGARPDTRHFRHHAEAPLSLDLLVVDEASMVDLEMMAALLDAMPAEARLILLGDKDQLASVEAGSVLGDLCAGAGDAGYSEATRDYLQAIAGEPLPVAAETNPLADHVAMLRRSFRFRSDSGIGALARAANAGDGRDFTRLLKSGFQDVETLDIDAAAFERAVVTGYRPLFEALRGGADVASILALQGRFQVLCALRRGPWGVEGLNDRIARALWQQGWISRTDGWFAGRPVMVTHNDPQLGLYNGDLGLTLADDAGRLRVCFPQGDGIRQVLPSRLDAAATAFAMTVHKSQGSEFDHVLFALPARANPIVTRELIYTGITRARSRLTLALAQGGNDERTLREAIARQVVRDSAIAERLLGLPGSSVPRDSSGSET
ncbi:MAG: exodeoxyribonuclease V subunit alpha [Salinicola sp.]|uniref:exodeoxyribonuclease V subunit alpha n=1 Tax=uncultured Salinicola sp. TaxID=1193542 RepID=UPI000C996A96|nr:exodeoxyribonuclease V subunit alpha [uncultured Salinicola sp.]MAM56013.1 exodeoxyribonuclease V subunit alpha [Salinicola sp.]